MDIRIGYYSLVDVFKWIERHSFSGTFDVSAECRTVLVKQ